MMQRYKFELSYNGTSYFGWQRQPSQISVQEEIEKAISKLFDGQLFSVVGCGRTDTGVHAKYYVLHVDLPVKWDLDILRYKLNRILSQAISIFSIVETNEEFHARFSAKARTYRYFLHAEKDSFLFDRSLYLNKKIDVESMNQAAVYLIGKQDFTSFSKLHTDVFTNICTVTSAVWVEYEKGKFYFEITADRFLRNMVRATVGTLLEVGLGKISIDDVKFIIAKKDRCEAKTSVPAHALYLWDISY
ncbi:MAG: tRNA pseudouridine(38-40) synthase TruA [Crocinitomicaceae bacterium]|jgi:tRNA pseudouridine38-40 synthase|nr:tRNA pseudouridine(38-40) synthase TruA [Crocinitomicaceae bacterium]